MLAVIICLFTISVLADAEYDGVIYSLDNTSSPPSAKVNGIQEGTSTVNIPSEITVDGTVYIVNGVSNVTNKSSASTLNELNITSKYITELGGFGSCTYLTKINITSPVETFKSYCFNNCTKVTDVYIDFSHTQTVESGVFQFSGKVDNVSKAKWNYNGEAINLYNVTYIGDNAFASSRIGGVFDGGTQNTIVWPKKTTYIGAFAFTNAYLGGTVYLNSETVKSNKQFSLNNFIEAFVIGEDCSTIYNFNNGGDNGIKSKLHTVVILSKKLVNGADRVNLFDNWGEFDLYYYADIQSIIDKQTTIGSATKHIIMSHTLSYGNGCSFDLSFSDGTSLLSLSNTHHTYSSGKSAVNENYCPIGAVSAFTCDCGAVTQDKLNEGYGAFAEHILTEAVVYAKGFGENGLYTASCSLCSLYNETELAPIVSTLGFSLNDSNANRLFLSSGYIVNEDAQDLYERINGVSLEIGIMFASTAQLGNTLPTSLEGINHFSDKGSTYSTYNYIIRFPKSNSADFERFANAQFVVSAFIFDGNSYYFYQGLSEGSEVNTLPSGLSSTSLKVITSDAPVTVEYDAMGGYFADGGEKSTVINSGEAISSHPTPLHYNEYMIFEGWFTDSECTRALDEDYIFTADITLYAKWSESIHTECTHSYDSTEILTQGTCTEAETMKVVCSLCGDEQFYTDESVKGHTWGMWSEGFLYAERVCAVVGCGATQRVDFDNITKSVTNSSLISFVGEAWGSYNTPNIIDGIWDQDNGATIAPKGSDCTITVNLNEATSVYRIYVKNRGSATLDVSVQYEGSGSFVKIGSLKSVSGTVENSVIPYASVDTSKKITSVKIDIKYPSYGTDYFEEVALIGIPKLSANAKDTVKVTFDTDIGYFSNPYDYSRYVEYGKMISALPTPLCENESKTFAGWYKDSAFTVPVSNTDIYEENTTLYAKFLDKGDCTSESGEHSFDSWTVVTAPTCISKGIKSSACSVCGKETIASIETSSHTETVIKGVEPNCTDTGISDKIVCSVCETVISGGELLPANGICVYNESNWATTTVATKYVNGKLSNTCTVCGKVGTRAVGYTATESDLSIDGVALNYTGGNYVNAPFTNVATLGKVYASSYFGGTYVSSIADGSYDSFWIADTLADGVDVTQDYFILELPKKYDIGAICLNIPKYNANEDTYASYSIEYYDDALKSWVFIGTISDKDITSDGMSCKPTLVLDSPVSTSEIRVNVTYSTRYAPALVYELEVFANADSFTFCPTSITEQGNISVSGKYNTWASGGDALVDNNLGTYWFTDWKNNSSPWAILDFGEEKYIACVQFSAKSSSSRTFKLEIFTDGEWVQIGNTYTTSKTIGANVIYASDGICTFNVDVERNASKIRLGITNDTVYWESYVYELSAYSISAMLGDSVLEGCIHENPQISYVVAPTCDTAGYTVMKCGCGETFRTEATDILYHEYEFYITDVLPGMYENDLIGTQIEMCKKCNATRSAPHNLSQTAQITPYLHNAPAAWAMTFDDGNYLSTYEWVEPQLEKYGFKATAMLTVAFSDSFVSTWQDYFARGAFDLGSHSYNHGSYYSAAANKYQLLNDVIKAQYWFNANFKGQKVLTFVAPNGTTSSDVANYLCGPFIANRNGGATGVFYNMISDLTSREVWGDMNAYVSKADQTEGEYYYADTVNGIIYAPSIDENGNTVYNLVSSYANSGINLVYDDAASTFVDKGYSFGGTYYYDSECWKYEYRETGSYNLVDGEFVFVNDESGSFRMFKATMGSYEKAIDTLVEKGAFTVECIHSLLPNKNYVTGTISSSYDSTISKFEYLTRKGVWAPSYNELAMYLKESQTSYVWTVDKTDNSQTVALINDSLDKTVFTQALTLKVYIEGWDDVVVTTYDGEIIPLVSYEEYTKSANMSKISCAIGDDGYLYVDVHLNDAIIITKK